MKLRRIFFSGMFLLWSAGLVLGQDVRENKLFNADWKFNLGDVFDAKNKDFDDSKWPTLNVPHDWSIELEYNSKNASSTAYLPGGIGWYRKSFIVPASNKDKLTSIYFEGIYNNSEVWINGHYLGKRPYGYISFSYDITPYLVYDQPNEIAVRVDRSKLADTRWYSGAGIYRNVWLITTSKLHIAQWGTTISTPVATPNEAQIQVVTNIENTPKSSGTGEIVYTVLDKNQKIVTIAKSKLTLNGQNTTVTDKIDLKNPLLWDIENPYLYQLRTSVFLEGNKIDETNEPFGIRAFNFDKNSGFSLNGKTLKLKGVCLHHDGGLVGAAVPEKIWKIRLAKLKAGGCNAIRTSHNPVAPEFLDLCDQMGFVVMDEAFDEWEYPKGKWINGWNNTIAGTEGYSQYFNEWSDRDLHDMVARDKNHPSIIMWSIGNEIDYANDPYADPEEKNFNLSKPDPKRMVDIAKRLKAVIKGIDTTRPVTMALADSKNSNKVGLPEVLDIVGYNYTESRYSQDHQTFPDRVIFGSENPHNYSGWLAVKDNDYICSQFLWTGVDYLGEAGKFPYRSAYSGLLDLTNNEKPIYYWRQSMWSEKPMLSLAARQKKAGEDINADPMGKLAWFISEVEEKLHWNYKTGDSVLVVAFSNCPEVELFLNKKSLGTKKYDPKNSCFWWYLPYEAGEVQAVSKTKDGKKLLSTLTTIFEPVKLAVQPDTTVLNADGKDVVVLEVKLLDKNNNCSYLAKNKIDFEIAGEATLVGTDNGDAACLDNFKLSSRNAYAGRCIAVIQSTGKPGKVTVKVKSAGLPDASIDLDAKK